MIHLVDASPYIFRAYFSMPSDMTSPSGAQVNAVYGYARMLLQLIEQQNVTHLGLTYDRSLNTSFRNDFYPEYKAQRELPPAELEAQLNWCVDIGKALGAPVYIDERYEADDFIATLCHQLEGQEIVMVTSDKDMAQLVNDKITLLDFAKDEIFDADAVKEKFGVRPEQIADYLGLAGDSVDNIPGVKGVGKKTAAALLEAFDDLEALYDGIDGVAALPIRGAKTLGKKLLDSREMAFLSRRLATVAVDAPATADLEELEWRGADRSILEPLVEELGFERLLDRVPRWIV